MTPNQLQNTFFSHFKEALDGGTFISASLGHYKGEEKDLKNIYIKSINIKQGPRLNLVFRYKTKDITKNYTFDEGLNILATYLSNAFLIGNLFTSSKDYQYEVLANGQQRLRQLEPSKSLSAKSQHDQPKQRLISSTSASYLHELGITDGEGRVYKKSQDKYKQINHYIEILSSLLAELPSEAPIHVADMGSGKGYLTFALYDYLTKTTNAPISVTGVEYRQDLVELCNQIASKSNFNNLHFIEGTIEQYEPEDLQVMIALHACDTATDDAIAKGINANADLIVVAPCCHKQIRRSMEASNGATDLQFLLKHGILMERQAEMVTDGIRALVLEYFGYKTKVFQFISDAHTPKNVMITALKTKRDPVQNQRTWKKIQAALTYFDIDYHHLLRILNL
ncbi:methyltransferase family protein [Dyadobacter jejuensis]|uniref:Methyltransferase family protein n=1 Tax=Dyadobacter jejuensis TaxID=1082580 RepID=A0A316AMU3_9BACT|nr:SAM-dependent methyltransferase [Dyadobacter jejuensis]PWJ58862.1 methyltransferase family protein [Dyadobacter jejuensis]